MGEQATLAVFYVWHEEKASGTWVFLSPQAAAFTHLYQVVVYLCFRIAAVLFSLFCRQIFHTSPAVWVELTLEAVLGTQSSFVWRSVLSPLHSELLDDHPFVSWGLL